MDSSMLVPMRFGDLDVMVRAVPLMEEGSEDVGVADRLRASYARVEPAVIAVASSVAGTINRLEETGRKPSHVQVQFGVGVSLGGEVVLIKGEATLAITLSYDIA